MKLNVLTPEEEHVILHKGTEAPFTGELLSNKKEGIYLCKRCNAILYRSEDKFESNCGWPSFDDEIPGAVQRIPDADGRRTEIVCARCGAHLGHVFVGEGFTDKDTRHCVNSVSMKFLPAENIRKAYFASGCFWGTEYWFQRTDGVIETTVGYMGGRTENPTYEEVCTGLTGHVETVEVLYDPTKISYEELLKLYYETHDFTQVGGQGPDIGSQYQSVLFYTSEEEKKMGEKYIHLLTERGYRVATRLEIASRFWTAEAYHQDYYIQKNGTPYCHLKRTIF